MARGKGFEGIVGVKKSSTWGTAVACATGDGIYVLDLATPGGTDTVPNKSITGTITRLKNLKGNSSATVKLKTLLRYEGLETIIALVMGTAGAPSTVDTSARLHVLKVKDSIEGIFSTLAYEIVKDAKIVELPGVKWNKLTVRGQPGMPIELEMEGIGSEVEEASAVNTTTTIDTITFASNYEVALMSQAVWWMNRQTAAALDTTYEVLVKSFEITVERPKETVFVAGSLITKEPVAGDHATVTVKLDFPMLQTAADGAHPLFVDQIGFIAQKATLALTGSTLAGAVSQYFTHKLWFPHMTAQPSELGIPGPGPVPYSLTFDCVHVSTIPTGFTAAYTQALVWDIYSQRATDALA